MGRVFTWEDVLTGHLPDPPEEKYPLAIRHLRAELERSNSVIGALHFGSLVRDDWTIRSDVDCLVLTEDSLPSQGADLAAIVMHANEEWNVEISFEIVQLNAGKSGRHTIGPMFLDYLRRVEAGNIIKQDPTALLSPSCFSSKVELVNYLMVQEERLRSGYLLHPSFTAEKYCHFLRKVSESGIHIARKHLQYRGHINALSRQTVIDMYGALFGGVASEILQQLVAVDCAYTKEMLWQQQHGPHYQRYHEALKRLLEATPLALEFVAINWNLVE